MTNLCFLMLRKLGCFWDGDKNIWKQVEFLPRWSHIYRKIGRPWGSGATAAKHADYHMWPMIILAITLGRFLIIEPVTFSCCPLGRTTNCKDKSYNYNHIRNLVENKKKWRRTNLKSVLNALLEKRIGMRCRTLIPPSSLRLENHVSCNWWSQKK